MSITWKAEEMGRVSAVAKPTVTHVRGHEVVPETVLRRRKTQAEVKEKREEILAAQRQKRSNKPAACPRQTFAGSP